jgi:hypothetical protein
MKMAFMTFSEKSHPLDLTGYLLAVILVLYFGAGASYIAPPRCLVLYFGAGASYIAPPRCLVPCHAYPSYALIRQSPIWRIELMRNNLT